MKRILLIEDEEKTAHFIKLGLEEYQYHVQLARDGIAGLQQATQNIFDIIITEISLPGMDGIEVCRTLRSGNFKTPILMLGALSPADDTINKEEIGADDYLTKPFEFKALIDHINTLLKPKTQNLAPDILVSETLVLDLTKGIVTRNQRVVKLSSKECVLLEYFLQNRGRLVSHAEIAKNVWKIEASDSLQMIEVYINYFRSKIDLGFEKKLIREHSSIGYIFED